MNDILAQYPLAADGRRRRRLLSGACGAVAAVALRPGGARAQAWPSRPIRIVAAQAPGSSNDATARAFADWFSGKLGVSVVVENKPGGLGMIAAETVARSAPDGHTLLLTLHSQLAQAPVLMRKPPIDTSRDLVPVAAMSTGAAPAVIHKDVPAHNLKELVELSKKRPVTVGNYSIGSGWQMMVTALARQTGGQFDIIQYKGTGPMMVDLIAGQIDMGAGSLAGVGPAMQRGAVRPIVVITGARSSKIPGTPTWGEEGFSGPAFENIVECNMLLAPGGTPRDIVDRLGQLVIESGSQSPKVMQVREQLAAEEIPLLAGEALQKFIDRTWPTYRELTRALNIRVD
jgi:tripartite-type tricarboxylate transporter receptor subunit TctC